MNKNWKIIVAVLFGLVILLGLAQRKYNPFSQTTTVTHFSNSGDDSLEDYYRKSRELSYQQNRQTVSFLAVGDIMLSRNVALAIEESKNINTPFMGMAYELDKIDFAFANLESPVSKSPTIGGHSLIFGAASSSLWALKVYKFEAVNLANNHALDQGAAGLDYTISVLDDFAISHTGSGENLDEAWQPAQIVTTSGIKVCFIGASYASINDNGKTTNQYVARIEDIENLKSAIKNSQLLCDFTVATMHAGTEYTREPNLSQIDFAHAAIDYGADLVIGHHPHWVQTIEKYNGRWIFYSLGNFIFDQAFSQDVKQGLTLKITISKRGNCYSRESGNLDSGSSAGMTCSDALQGSKIPATLDSIELIPVIIENSQPRPAMEEEAKKILRKINQDKNILVP